MEVLDFHKFTVITADRDCYLRVKGFEKSEEVLGKPQRIILNSGGKIPDYEEVRLDEALFNEVNAPATEVKTATKKTTKKTTKK